ADDDRVAATLFEQALELWRGPALASLDTPWVNNVRERLETERLAAEADRNDRLLAGGQHAVVLGELASGTAAHPLDERLAGQLMLALYRCGRQADALHHYQQVRLRLAEDLGVDPAPPLKRLYQQILTADSALTVAKIARPAPSVTPPAPRQLPSPPTSFSGRTRELAALDAVMATAERTATTVTVAAVSGTAGVGKTALVLHWAHHVAERFGDGQLYVNLRGFDPSGNVVDPGDAIRGFLDAFDIPPHRIPTSRDAQAALYRSLLANRRMLIVLDNARDAEQVRPLLPGTPGCLVLTTSRNQLTGLIASEGAAPVTLDLLTATEAGDLLARRLGPERVSADPDAASEIIARCARLPLALTIVAARAAIRPDLPLSKIAVELRDGLDGFDGGEAANDVRAVFSWSYKALSDAAAQLFRLLGLHPGPDFTAQGAASVAGVPPARARSLLAELVRAHLLAEHSPGRYILHDLLRAYATEQTHAQDTDAERRAAVRRVLDHYAHTAFAAARMLDPKREPIDLAAAQPGVTARDFIDHGSAMRWLTIEHPGLLAAVEQAGRLGFDTHVRQVAWTLGGFFHRRGHWHDWVRVQRAAFEAAGRGADRPGQAHALRGLARAYARLGRNDDAFARAREALDLFAGLRDHAGQAKTHLDLAWMYARQGDHREALGHSQQGLELFRSANHRDGQSIALNNIGMAHVRLGEHQQALSYCHQALDLSRETGNRLNEAESWDSLGCVHHNLDQYQRAVACYEHALDGFRSCEHLDKEARTLSHLADAHHAAGHHTAAAKAWQRALAILAELDPGEADRVRAKLSGLAADHTIVST
ncbi:MAG TPA: BTAD domain-containing putative transcriptional regulator, partial [Pilimelia sp.]|nr:BTAD domain-containing putative transcriptional regulator [Pilimelia sp.]